MTRIRRMFRGERGQAMILVVVATVVLGVLAATLIDLTTREGTTSAQGVTSDTAYQAAEAGIDDYVAKLLDDHLYYQHDVAAGESTRNSGSITTSSSGTAAANWTGGSTWTYPNGRDNWRQLSNGYYYNLEITPPTSTSQVVAIQSTGRSNPSTTANQQVLQTLIRPSSVADFQMLADANISYGSSATTYGKVYSTGNVNHQGTAYGDVYAEGQVTGNPTLMNGAQTYDSNSNPTIRSVIPTPVSFTTFLTSLVDIQRAAQASPPWGGVYLNDPTKDAWLLVFNSNGTFTAASCTKTGGADPAQTAPTCGTATTYNMPANGAIYAGQTVVIGQGSSTCGAISNGNCVNGRVTVASNNDIVIGDDIDYVQTGDDVLGLIAKNDMVVAKWVANNLTWRAATIAQTGQWTDYCGYAGSSCGSHGTMTFTGSTATEQGGSMSMFTTRVYNYDNSLLYLEPPWFPTVQNAYTIVMQRQLPGD